MAILKSRMPLPRARPASGRRFGPSTRSATTRTNSRWVGWRMSPIMHASLAGGGSGLGGTGLIGNSAGQLARDRSGRGDRAVVRVEGRVVGGDRGTGDLQARGGQPDALEEPAEARAARREPERAAAHN